MIENQLLDLIKAEQTKIVEGMIQFPADDLAKYNRQVGLHQGLEKAIELLTGLISDEDDET